MTQPIMKARLRPIIAPTLAPGIPVTVVPTSSATVAIETFITELSSAIRNCPAASVSRITWAPAAAVFVAVEPFTAPALQLSGTPWRQGGRCEHPAKGAGRLDSDANAPCETRTRPTGLK